MSCSTGSRTHRNQTQDYLHYVELIPSLYGNGLTTCFPCPTDLFKDIIYINQLRDKRDQSDEDKTLWSLSIQNVFSDITKFSPLDWVSDVVLTHIAAHTKYTSTGESPPLLSDPLLSAWLSVGHIYQCTVALYWIGALSGLPGALDSWWPPQDGLRISDVRESYYKTLIIHIKNICLTPNKEVKQLRKILMWPLVVAGVETEAKDEGNKSLVMEQLDELTSYLGTFATLDAKEFLDRHWASTAHMKSSRMRWDRVFDKDFCFAM